MPAPNTWGAGKRFPSTVSEGFLRLAQGKTSCESGSVLGGVAASPDPMWPKGLQPLRGCCPPPPPLSMPNIALTQKAVKTAPAAPRDRDGRCQPRCASSAGAASPRLQLGGGRVRPSTHAAWGAGGEWDRAFKCTANLLRQEARRSLPRAAWGVMGEIKDGIMGQGCKSGV